MHEYKQVTKTVIARATQYGRKPTSEYQALHQARLLLEEEGRWCSGDLFQDGDPEDVFENGSFCSFWQVCAAGAVGIVTGDMPISITKEWYTGNDEEPDYEWDPADESAAFFPGSLSFKALQILALAIKLNNGEIELHIDGGIWQYEDGGSVDWLDDPTSVVYNGNDSSNRADVVEHFKAAEELAKDKKKLTKIVSDIRLTPTPTTSASL